MTDANVCINCQLDYVAKGPRALSGVVGNHCSRRDFIFQRVCFVSRSSDIATKVI